MSWTCEFPFDCSQSERGTATWSAQRARWEIIGGGYGIHWEELDEDISVRGLLRLH